MKHTRLLLVSMSILLSPIISQATTRLQHMHPLNWWSGMLHNQIQVMLHGSNIGDCSVALENANQVQLLRVERVENQNYLFVYLDLKQAPAQTFQFVLTKPGQNEPYIQQPYEILQRSDEPIETFGPQDVVYLLMPDRFINGNTKLDTVPNMVEPVVNYTDAMDFGRHGGDLAGIEKALPYLADLGITALWPTPVQTNDCTCSYHGYAISNYYEIDPRFGSNEEYKALVQHCHKHGIKMLMDMVFNHCGEKNFMFTDLPQKDFFSYNTEFHETVHRTASIGDPHASQWDQQHTVEGWFVKQMPDWNQKNPLVKDYLIQCSIWWVEYARLNGYRQDTYPYSDKYMMRDWCLALDQEYPGFNIMGETWINYGPGIAYWQKDSKLSDFNSELKTVMDFPLMNLLREALDEESNDYDRGLMKIYNYIAGDAIYANPLYLLTFLDNHDTNRFQATEQEALNINRYKQALLLVTTLRGIPQLYYGDELGMYANKDEGDGWLRQDFPSQALNPTERTPLQSAYHEYASLLLNWRKQCKAVQWGKLTHFGCQHGCYVYSRHLDTERVTFFLNGTDKEQTINLERYAEVIPKVNAVNLLTGKTLNLSEKMILEPRQSVIAIF